MFSLTFSYLILAPIFSIAIAGLNIPKVFFTSALIVFILAFPILIYYVLKPAYNKEIIFLNGQFIFTTVYGNIELKSIDSIKLKSYKTGSGVELILKSKFKLVVSPSNQFSSVSSEIVTDFYLALTRSYNQINQSS